MKKVDISESPNEIIENDEDKDKGYSKIPIDQINLNTEPISIINDFNYSYLDNNIKSYIKVFLGFVIFVIFLLLISILSGHFHYEKPGISEKKDNNKKNENEVENDNDIKMKKNVKKQKLQLNLRNLKDNIDIHFFLKKYKLNKENDSY